VCNPTAVKAVEELHARSKGYSTSVLPLPPPGPCPASSSTVCISSLQKDHQVRSARARRQTVSDNHAPLAEHSANTYPYVVLSTGTRPMRLFRSHLAMNGGIITGMVLVCVVITNVKGPPGNIFWSRDINPTRLLCAKRVLRKKAESPVMLGVGWSTSSSDSFCAAHCPAAPLFPLAWPIVSHLTILGTFCLAPVIVSSSLGTCWPWPSLPHGEPHAAWMPSFGCLYWALQTLARGLGHVRRGADGQAPHRTVLPLKINFYDNQEVTSGRQAK